VDLLRDVQQEILLAIEAVLLVDKEDGDEVGGSLRAVHGDSYG
jgi:hypothetical protein